MSAISHLDMFYETRSSVHVTDSNPANNPNTELNSVPEVATIHFEEYEDREIDSHAFEGPDGKGYEIAQWFVGRAMLDPDATVVPA